MEFLDAGLVAKLLATATVVVAATLIAERAGPFIGAMIVSLPVSAGPSYLFLALEHGPDFIASSATTSLAITAFISPFLLLGAALVPRLGGILGLSLAFLAWLAGAWAVLQVGDRVSLPVAIGLNAVAFPICLFMARLLPRDVVPNRGRQGLTDLLIRLLAVCTIVGAAIVAGRLLGPEAAGIMALVPVVWLSTASVICARSGREACAATLSNGVIGMVGFSVALATLAAIARHIDLAASLSIALAICVGWNLGLMLLRYVGGARTKTS